MDRLGELHLVRLSLEESQIHRQENGDDQQEEYPPIPFHKSCVAELTTAVPQPPVAPKPPATLTSFDS